MHELPKNHLDPASETLAEQLTLDPDFRVLRALPKPFASMPANGAPPDGRCIGIVDLETTSLSPELGAIIELAVKLVFVDDDGQLLGHFPIYSWLSDPGHPLDPVIRRLTGLTDADLAGRAIDDEAVARILDRADLLVAHNARFDLQWIERRWPALKGRAWACSCNEIDWSALGFEGRSQHHLLLQHCAFSKAHRAAADVWSLFWLLLQSKPDPDPELEVDYGANAACESTGGRVRTHLQRLLEASDRPSVMVDAVYAPFDSKEKLRARGYRWDARLLRRVWWKELPSEAVEFEQAWFARNGLPQPQLTTITARERHR